MAEEHMQGNPHPIVPPTGRPGFNGEPQARTQPQPAPAANRGERTPSFFGAVRHTLFPPAGSMVNRASNVREVIETIVFVVVLVLLLKSFVAEAFVIPTGSMATTLYGYQKTVKCDQCGYPFPVNASQEADPPDGGTAQEVIGCICPNCRAHNDLQHRNPKVVTNTGDRVLVMKCLYDLPWRSPQRLDVV